MRKERALHYQPEFVGKHNFLHGKNNVSQYLLLYLFFLAHIINACYVLHNTAVKWRVPPSDIYLEDIDQEAPVP